MYATISADIVSSTSLSKEATIALKQRIESLFRMLEQRIEGFWGRIVKGDYIECVVPNVSYSFRVALIIKTCIKSFGMKGDARSTTFRTYGVRLAIGIGDLRTVDRCQDIIDGEAIYMSGRAIENMQSLSKGTMTVEISDAHQSQTLKTIAILTDAIVNSATQRQSEVLYYKLLSMKEIEIAKRMGIKQASVNEHSALAKWYGIEEALRYFEQVKF